MVVEMQESQPWERDISSNLEARSQISSTITSKSDEMPEFHLSYTIPINVMRTQTDTSTLYFLEFSTQARLMAPT